MARAAPGGHATPWRYTTTVSGGHGCVPYRVEPCSAQSKNGSPFTTTDSTSRTGPSRTRVHAPPHTHHRNPLHWHAGAGSDVISQGPNRDPVSAQMICAASAL